MVVVGPYSSCASPSSSSSSFLKAHMSLKGKLNLGSKPCSDELNKLLEAAKDNLGEQFETSIKSSASYVCVHGKEGRIGVDHATEKDLPSRTCIEESPH